MNLYMITDDVLSPIDRDSFRLERDIQNLVQKNLETLFSLELVASEFCVDNFRLDTLAFNPETSSFVIIEYKKGNSYSVVDQGYSYLSVMLNNKAEFVLEYNEKTSHNIKRSDVDWTASKVMFVAPSFNNHQKNSVNFRDIPFELWQIKRFSGGLIALEQLSSKSSESIENLAKQESNSVISRVSSEVKAYSEEFHLSKASSMTRRLWETLKDRLGGYADSSFFICKGYISWRRETTAVCFIHFRKNELRIEVLRGNKKPDGGVSQGFFTFDDPKSLADERTWTWKSGVTGVKYVISLDSEKEVDYIIFLLNQKYESME